MSAPGSCTVEIATAAGAAAPQFILAGNLVRFLIAFKDVSNTPTNPTTVTVTIGTSYYDELSLTPVHDSTGVWHADWDTTSAVQGTYYCEVSGTGVLQAASETSIKIRTPHL